MIELEEVRRLLGDGAQLLDVLSEKEWEDSHVPGATHIPLSALDEQSAKALARDRPVIAYCYDYQ
jgi:rhodanese-related sulfurtransferase